MTFQTATRIAPSRNTGDDRVAVIAVDSGLVIVVADGAGGLSGGAEAAERVVQSAWAAVPTLTTLTDPEVWHALMVQMDLEVERDPEAGESAAVIVAVTPAGLAGASVGDCEAWMLTPGDSAEPGVLDLTEHQCRKPLLGSGAARPQSFHAGPFSETLLVATDGLFDYADTDRLRRTACASSLAGAADFLVSLARLPSGGLQDDIALVLCRLQP